MNYKKHPHHFVDTISSELFIYVLICVDVEILLTVFHYIGL